MASVLFLQNLGDTWESLLFPKLVVADGRVMLQISVKGNLLVICMSRPCSSEYMYIVSRAFPQRNVVAPHLPAASEGLPDGMQA